MSRARRRPRRTPASRWRARTLDEVIAKQTTFPEAVGARQDQVHRQCDAACRTDGPDGRIPAHVRDRRAEADGGELAKNRHLVARFGRSDMTGARYGPRPSVALASAKDWCRLTSNSGRQARVTGRTTMILGQVRYYSCVGCFRCCCGGGPAVPHFGASACATGGGCHRQRRHRRRRRAAERAGGRRLGDRGNHRSADEIRQDRRHRRPGPLRRSPTCRRRTTGLGARLRPGRFAQDARASPASSSI